MRAAELLGRMHALGGPETASEAQAVLYASLSALRAHLSHADKEVLAKALPAALRPALEGPHSPGEVAVDALAAELASTCKLAHGPALEQLEIACRVLSELLREPEREALLRRLPGSLVPLFASPRPEHAPAHPAHAANGKPHATRTLAEGRAGSAHPLSEGHPGAGQGGSVAGWDGSAAARTLAGYRGDEREQQGETLATGKPGSKRGLSDG